MKKILKQLSNLLIMPIIMVAASVMYIKILYIVAKFIWNLI